MMHLENHTLLAHLDGELTDEEERAVLEHLADCAECGSALAALRADSALVSSAVQARDALEPERWRDVSPIELRRESAKVIPLHNGRRATMPAAAIDVSPGRRFAYVRWAASILLVTATAVSAVVLRSGWKGDGESSTPEAVPAQPAPPKEQAAVLVFPRDGSVRVELRNVGVDSRVLVTFEDRTDASVSVMRDASGAAAPHFTAEAGRVAIDARGVVAQVNLVLPRAVRNAVVTLDGATLVTVRGTRVSPAHAATTGVVVKAASEQRVE